MEQPTVQYVSENCAFRSKVGSVRASWEGDHVNLLPYRSNPLCKPGQKINSLALDLKKMFDISNIGRPIQLLTLGLRWMQIGSDTLNQTRLTDKLLKITGMSKLKPIGSLGDTSILM